MYLQPAVSESSPTTTDTTPDADTDAAADEDRSRAEPRRGPDSPDPQQTPMAPPPPGSAVATRKRRHADMMDDDTDTDEKRPARATATPPAVHTRMDVDPTPGGPQPPPPGAAGIGSTTGAPDARRVMPDVGTMSMDELIRGIVDMQHPRPPPPTLADLEKLVTDGHVVVLDDASRAASSSPEQHATYVGYKDVTVSQLLSPMAGRPVYVATLRFPALDRTLTGAAGLTPLQAARFRDMLVTKMLLCGARWAGAELYFPIADYLAHMTPRRVLAMTDWHEYAYYLNAEVGLTRLRQRVLGYRGVFRNLKTDMYQVCVWDKAECEQVVVDVPVSRQAMREARARAQAQVPVPVKLEKREFSTVREAAVAYDRYVVLKAAYRDFKLNYSIQNYMEELRASPGFAAYLAEYACEYQDWWLQRIGLSS